MRILVICTASDEYVFRLLKRKYANDDCVCIYITDTRANAIKTEFPRIEAVTTSLDRIDYYDFKTNNDIRERNWDEIWLLSSGKDNFWDYVDAICIISELRYKCLYFLDADGKEMQFKNGITSRLLKTIENVLVQIWFDFNASLCRVISCVKGYRW